MRSRLLGMDSRLNWSSVLVLLVLGLQQQSCSSTESFKCVAMNLQLDASITNSTCQYTSGLEFKDAYDGSEKILMIKHQPPVEVEFQLPLPNPLDGTKIEIVPTDQNCSGNGTFLTPNDGYLVTTYLFNDETPHRLEFRTDDMCGENYIVIRFEQQGSVESDPRPKIFIGLGIAGGLVAIIFLVVVVVMRRRLPWHKLSPMNSENSKSSSVSDLSDLEIGAPHQYSYKELSSATHSFSSKYVVGEGGFGTVYKGVLKDTRYPVAIKRLSQYARQGAREFIAEVKIISQLRHRNLVQLLGWCLEKDELILVYEYMPNGDLDDLIYADKPECDLSWKQRYNILCGVATALVYLHEEWLQRVVHRDVKTSNVMLDSNLNARLGDFGLARLSAHSQAPNSTLVAGTLGYLAPEFSMSGKATDKTDVYAFGVVALEVSCARRPLSPDLVLVDWVWDLHKQDRLLDAVDPRIDPKLRSSDEEVQIKIVLQVALLCCHPDPNARPTMRQVLNVLTGEASIPRVPRSKPVASYFEDD